MVDLREFFCSSCTLSANPHFYDYVHFFKLGDDGKVEMVEGGGQALRQRIIGRYRVVEVTAGTAVLHFYDLFDTDPYERRPETKPVEDLRIHVEVEEGPFALECGVVWHVTEEEWPFLLFGWRLRLSEDPLRAGFPPLPRELLEHPDPEAQKFIRDLLRGQEETRRYFLYSAGRELKRREIQALGLPERAFVHP